LYSCDKTTNINERYFTPSYTKEGIINKYYNTIHLKNKQNTKTGLDYSWIKKLNDSIYSKEVYNPAFKIQSSKEFMIQGSEVIETSYKRFYSRDTLTAVYPDNVSATYMTFGKDSVYYDVKLKNKDSIHILVRQSTKMIKDTIVDNKQAKIIEQVTTNTVFFGKTPRDTTMYQVRSVYVEDIGLWQSTLTADSYIRKKILVEQLLPEQFDKISKHNIKRVGYIDFDNTIDKDNELDLCTSHEFIADYYNGGNDRAGFIGGKGNLKKLVLSKLNTSKLNNESGYLTFRFVINCKGQAGKFVTNQADFKYNEKQFSEETIMHLYDIISGVKHWRPVIIRNTKRDSYFYVTFILKNGAIQDILP